MNPRMNAEGSTMYYQQIRAVLSGGKLFGSLQHERGAGHSAYSDEDDTEKQRESDGARKDCVLGWEGLTVLFLY